MHKNNMRFMILVSCLILCSLLAGCANEYQIEPYDYKAEYERVSKAKSNENKTKKEIDITDIAQRRSNYRYSAVGKKDPFRNYFGDMASLNKEKKIVSELQNFDVTDLRLSAIIYGITDPKAVVISPDGKSYIVKKGSFIGKNWGKINRILPDKLEIIETYKDPLGRKIINKLYLELPIKSPLKESEEPEDAAEYSNGGEKETKENLNN